LCPGREVIREHIFGLFLVFQGPSSMADLSNVSPPPGHPCCSLYFPKTKLDWNRHLKPEGSKN
jgi:hypothetical protein